MDVSDVLKEYLELFSADCRHLKLLIAPNAVVDWFGRSVRGAAKIHDYLRFEVAPQYEHANFEKAKVCEPIEQKPAHWETKSLLNGDIDYVLPINKVSGISSLKPYADSDIDDDDFRMLQLPSGNQTPDHYCNSTTPIGELTPPSSTIKRVVADVSDSESDLDDADDGVTVAKRLKRSEPSPFSYLRRLPTENTKVTQVPKRQITMTQFGTQFLGDDTSSEDELDEDFRVKIANEYTPLQYIETTGILHVKPQQMATGTPSNRISVLDRPIRLRISYRRRLSDQELQIALVIYEQLCSEPAGVDQNMVAAMGLRRRNLIAQLNEVALIEQPTSTQEFVDTEVIEATEVNTDVPLLDGEEETTAISVMALRTPTRSVHTPPATPKRRPRIPYNMSGMKRINPSSSTSTPKRSAARTLRL